MRQADRRGRIVVVGASTAGLAAAETLRQEGFDGELTIVGEEPHLPYRRPPLSKQVLAGSWDEDRAFVRSTPEIDRLDASWTLGVRAVALDPTSCRVSLSDHSRLPYEGLVIATGVAPRRLPGAHDLDGVHVLRTLGDTRLLRPELVAGRRLVVVGAGFLGCEVAAVARRTDVHVTVVDPLPAPMIRQLGAIVAGHVAALHREHGVDVRSGVGVHRLGGRDGRVTAVELTDGSTLPADVVLVAVGSTPATQWLAGSGLSLDDGVDCDAYCRATPDIVAAGDVASWHHADYGRRMRLEHQTNALEQGAAAARSLLHVDAEPFTPVPFFWSDQYDVKLQVYGAPHHEATTEVVRGDPADGRFAMTYRLAGRLVAVLTWNMPREALGLRAELVDELALGPAPAR